MDFMAEQISTFRKKILKLVARKVCKRHVIRHVEHLRLRQISNRSCIYPAKSNVRKRSRKHWNAKGFLGKL